MPVPEKRKDRLQVPLMLAFRDAFEKRDAEAEEDIRRDGERVITARGSLHRRGVGEKRLREDLDADLGNLLDTINLGSAVELDDLPRVRASVLNYGVEDLTHIAMGTEAAGEIGEGLRLALVSFEPRLIPETLQIEKQIEDDVVGQRVRFRVRADLNSKPFDIPVEFIAELDGVAGKVIVPRLTGA